MAFRYVLLTAAMIALAGCGVKGPLEAPTSAATTPASSEIIDGDTTEEKPRQRIILDGLLE